MTKYCVTLLVDASIHVTVEAKDKEEAISLALRTAHSPALCHQCSERLDVGDIYDVGEAEKV